MVIFADESRKSELMDIWQQCFGDSKQYICMFLENNFSHMKIPAYEAEGKIVSAAYLLPITFCHGKEEQTSCYYLYAAATLPEYQGSGYFSQILQYVQSCFSEPIILVPAEKSLEAFYEKHGFFSWLDGEVVKDSLQEILVPATMKEMDAARYYFLREQILKDTPHMKWSREFVEYLCMENAFCGGKQIEFQIEDRVYIAMYRKSEETMHCIEILPHENLDVAVQMLLKEADCRQAVTCIQPHVMATKQLARHEAGYFNLTMG